ncbi:MAG: IMPACT family protein [Burkholderiaceae bacterium]
MYQLAAPVSAEIEIKKSRFLGMLFPLASRAEARAQLDALRRLHPGACHVCWVLICDGDSGLNDDGEPSGTAAKPMYNVLMHKDLTNVLAVVVRYWGGIKLGAGGLTRAYGQAISEAVKTAVLVPVEAQCERQCVLQFADESSLRRLCEQHQVTVINAAYSESVTLKLCMKLQQVEAFEKAAYDLLRGAVRIGEC